MGSFALAHGLSGCGAQAQSLWCSDLIAPPQWGLSSQPGVEPTGPALQGAFLTTGPPGKPHSCFPSGFRPQPPRLPCLSLAWLAPETCRAAPIPRCSSAPCPLEELMALVLACPLAVALTLCSPSSESHLLLPPFIPLSADSGCNCPHPLGLRAHP